MKLCYALLISLFVLMFAGAGYADNDGMKRYLTGTVTAIDLKESNFTVKDRVNGQSMVIRVDPSTDFEIENKGLINLERDAALEDLKVNDSVKVELIPNIYHEFIADEVDVYRK